MYLIAIGWLYVALMMSVAEATNTNGSILGAIITFALYGVGPIALVMYIGGAPGRRQARKAREMQELEAWRAAQAGQQPATGSDSVPPDARGQAPADAVTAVRKEP